MKRSAVTLLLLASFAVAQTGSTGAKTGTKVSSVRDAWITAFNAKQADKVAALYASDAILILPTGTISGRDAIRAQMQKDMDAGATDVKVVSMKSGGDADFQWDSGDFSEKVGGQETAGRYLVNLKLVGGKWWIVAHSSVPAKR